MDGSKIDEEIQKDYGPYSTTLGSMEKFAKWLQSPVVWFRETIVLPNRTDYPWYHRQFRRVPEIDSCYTDDMQCIYEADEQYKRDKWVDQEVVEVLKRRKDACYVHEGPDARVKCAEMYEEFQVAVEDYFTKYGDLGYAGNVKRAFMKQKHRLIWERRYGPIGSGKITHEERRRMAEIEKQKKMQAEAQEE